MRYVWAGIVDDCIEGPHVLPHRLTGNSYRDFLLHDFPKLLQVVPLAVRARMHGMHDRAPAHFSRAVQDVLSNTYHELMRQSMMIGVEACIGFHEGHFEHLCFRAHVDMNIFSCFGMWKSCPKCVRTFQLHPAYIGQHNTEKPRPHIMNLRDLNPWI
jgi:hypothetical protein